MKIKRICAWCNRDMGWAIWENFDESLPRITHSICDECSTKVLNDLNRTEGKNQENKSQLTIERRFLNERKNHIRKRYRQGA